MAFYNVNLEDAVGGSFEPPEPGEYHLLIHEVTPTLNKNSGARQMQVGFEIQDEGPMQGRRFNRWYSVEATNPNGEENKGLIFTKLLCVAAGVNFGANGFDDDELKGKTIIADLSHRRYTGQDGDERTDVQLRRYRSAEENGSNGNGNGHTTKAATKMPAMGAAKGRPQTKQTARPQTRPQARR